MSFFGSSLLTNQLAVPALAIDVRAPPPPRTINSAAARGLSRGHQAEPSRPRGTLSLRYVAAVERGGAERGGRPARVRVVDDWAHPALLCDQIEARARRPLGRSIPPSPPSRARARERVAPPRARGLSSALGRAPPRASPPPFFPR